MRARGWILTVTGWLIALGSLVGAWRSRAEWDWIEQGLWTLGILIGAVVTLIGYRRLWPRV